MSCPQCKATLFKKEVQSRLNVCPECGYHFYLAGPRTHRATARRGQLRGVVHRTSARATRWDSRTASRTRRSSKAEQAKTGMTDAAVVGKGFIRGRPVVLGITDFAFMAGSMGSVVGEKLTRAVEEATRLTLPLIIVSGSGGGARMQEGILSLMQMAKVSAALGRYDQAGGLYISILTNPTMGGVAASFGAARRHHAGRAGRADRLRRRAHDLEHGAPRTARRLSDQRVPAGARLRRPHRSSQGPADRGRAHHRLLRKMIGAQQGHSGRWPSSKECCRGSVLEHIRQTDAASARCCGRSGARRLPITDVAKRFELRGRTGQGSMSKVCRAYDKQDRPDGLPQAARQGQDRQVRGPLHQPGTRQAVRRRSLHVAASIRNCVATYEHGMTTEGEPYLVMEWIDGLGLNYLIETKSPQLKGNRVNYLKQFVRRRRVPARRKVSAPRHLPAQRHGRPRKAWSS